MTKDRQSTVSVIKKYDVRARKKFGQNFLKDENILQGIVDAAGIGKEDTVLEIGPGTGALTAFLCEAAGRVIAVEIDRDTHTGRELRDTGKCDPDKRGHNENGYPGDPAGGL